MALIWYKGPSHVFPFDSIRQTILSHLIQVHFAFVESQKTVLSFFISIATALIQLLMPHLRHLLQRLSRQ